MTNYYIHNIRGDVYRLVDSNGAVTATYMRFMLQDTYLGDAGSPASRNLYTYCNNDPINNCDPTGHWGSNIHRKITEKAFAEVEFLKFENYIEHRIRKIEKKIIRSC